MNQMCCLVNEQIACIKRLGCGQIMSSVLRPAKAQISQMCPNYQYVEGCSEAGGITATTAVPTTVAYGLDTGDNLAQNLTDVWETLHSLTRRVEHLEEKGQNHRGHHTGHNLEHHREHQDGHHGRHRKEYNAEYHDGKDGRHHKGHHASKNSRKEMMRLIHETGVKQIYWG